MLSGVEEWMGKVLYSFGEYIYTYVCSLLRGKDHIQIWIPFSKLIQFPVDTDQLQQLQQAEGHRGLLLDTLPLPAHLVFFSLQTHESEWGLIVKTDNKHLHADCYYSSYPTMLK